MNTRTAKIGSPLRQERWTSSASLSKGVLANLVALRLGRLATREERECAWWLQWRSWQDGGLSRVAEELAASSLPECLRDSSEEAFKRQAWRNRRVLAASQDEPEASGDLPKGELTPASSSSDGRALAGDKAVEALTEVLCNPAHPVPAGLCEAVRTLAANESERSRGTVAKTALVDALWRALDDVATTGSSLLAVGAGRTGKTTAARIWCEASRGMARYVAVPHGNDLDSLVRAVAAAVGCASGLTFKLKQVEERLFRALPGSGVLLVLDNAHYLWPQGDTRQSHPRRLQWLIGLMGEGRARVPVAMVATPQWIDSRREFIGATGWAVEQLDGRLGRVIELPGALARADYRAIAETALPAGDGEAWNSMAILAEVSSRRLGAIEAAAMEAEQRAERDGRKTPEFRDVKAAVAAAVETDAQLAKWDVPKRTPAPARRATRNLVVPQRARGGVFDLQPETPERR